MVTLTISLSDAEFASLLADAIAKGHLAGAGMVTETVTQEVTGDPWTSPQATETPANPSGGTTTDPSPGAAPSAARTSPVTTSSASDAIPTCLHGPMRLVPSGFSKKTGKPYPAFWACQAPRGTEQCKGQDA